MTIFKGSSFFEKHPGKALPTPTEIRAFNADLNAYIAIHRPPPVRIPSLGLLVKYGSGVTINEAQTQMYVHKTLLDQVPVPEVFGWTEDKGQVFIYMALIEADPLQTRWGNMSESERRAVCAELKQMAKAWRKLDYDEEGPYIGSIGAQPLKDNFLDADTNITGPFRGPNAIKDFHRSSGIEISGETVVAFTHNDMVASNILLSRDPSPKVAAVIDWGQSGWYPAYWEFCKARRVGVHPKYFSLELQDEWRKKYLPTILDAVDDETRYHPWLWFALSRGY